MPVFLESGLEYPLLPEIEVFARYLDKNGRWMRRIIGDKWAPLPLVTYSRIARRQIAYNGKDKLVLTFDEFHEGVFDILKDILRSLDIAYKSDDPTKPFPALQVATRRETNRNALRCLYVHRGLLAFKLVARAKQKQLEGLMWEFSLSCKTPTPEWVHAVWYVLKDHDTEYLKRTVLAGVYAWKKPNLTPQHLEGIRKIADEAPDLWEVIRGVMAHKYGEGYGEWLISEDDEDMEDESISASSSSSSVGEESSEEAGDFPSPIDDQVSIVAFSPQSVEDSSGETDIASPPPRGVTSLLADNTPSPSQDALFRAKNSPPRTEDGRVVGKDSADKSLLVHTKNIKIKDAIDEDGHESENENENTGKGSHPSQAENDNPRDTTRQASDYPSPPSDDVDEGDSGRVSRSPSPEQRQTKKRRVRSTVG